jgi:putative ABC transport system ATP-binding protein
MKLPMRLHNQDTKNTIEIMSLLLDINVRSGTTMVMVTHNPDLECYADRIVYVRDGKLEKQAINMTQCKLHYSKYVEFLNRHDPKRPKGDQSSSLLDD